MKKTLLSIPLLAITAFGAEYIIPPEYDNMVNSVKSHNSILISNLIGTDSSLTYKIGNMTGLRLKCANVPKINCRGGITPIITLSIGHIPVLREPIRQQNLTAEEARAVFEDGGINWRVCGGAMGAVRWDTSSLTQDATTKEITYDYTPLTSVIDYYFFTDIPTASIAVDDIDSGNRRGDDSSYMIIEAVQTCQ